MLGPVFLVLYRVIAGIAVLLGTRRGSALKAAAAVRFAAMSDGGLDDDFAEQAFQLVRARPEILDRLDRQEQGTGMFALRRRLTIQSIRQAMNDGRTSLF